MLNNKYSVDINEMWYKTIEKYEKNKEKIINCDKEYDNKVITKIDNFVKKCTDSQFHVAFVGAIKAGKSTLINSILGIDCATTSVTPETASVTKFRSSTMNNFLRINFYNEEEWEHLCKSIQESNCELSIEEFNNYNVDELKEKWVGKGSVFKTFKTVDSLTEELKKWTSSKEKTHYFVKEVEVGLEEFNLPDGVVFVDTPGLNDPIKYRSNITKNYIDRANAVLVCVKADALTETELDTINSVFENTRYNREKTYIIATQIDTLNKPKEDWEQQSEIWKNILSGESCYNNRALAEKNLIPVSAEVKNLIRDYENLEEESEQWWDLNTLASKFRMNNFEDTIDILNKFCNVDSVLHTLEDDIVKKHKELFIEDLIEGYSINKEDIFSKLYRNKKSKDNKVYIRALKEDRNKKLNIILEAMER